MNGQESLGHIPKTQSPPLKVTYFFYMKLFLEAEESSEVKWLAALPEDANLGSNT